MTGYGRSPDEIQREIGETQANLARAISQLERKFKPSEWLEDVTGTLRSRGGHRLADAIRDNPVPAGLIALGIAWLAVSVASTTPQPDRFAADGKGWRRRAVLSAQSLIGDEVRNLENQGLGRIEDIMIDVPTGRVAYAVLSFGGIMGMGGKLFALPWQALRVDERRRQVWIDIDRARLREAPGFDKDDWPDMADLSWGHRVHGFWMGRDGDVLHRRVMSAGSLAGDTVRNRAGQDLGTIEATMVDLADGRVVYTVLAFGGTLGFGEKLFAVPWRVLRLNEQEKRFILDADPERLKQMQGFDKDKWPDMADPAWSSRIEMQFAR
ncbi:PRC-barrel domain-containing protein [Skermanella mucosa]|uniref:PRC-barrel domain-containing protein n=1 Tax=Skermanella mucosa TaxID=1789672 RepID=UPI00192B7FBF|nr:PRC-barrel domain-containing protein [Skermanella mucosa]UEM23771.1 PRC-barrel domain-containing protein [Skermanella mucosa]